MKFWERLVKYFFSGLAILLPIFITAWLTYLIFSFADGFLGKSITAITGIYFPGLGIVASVMLIFAVGYLASYVLGKRIIRLGERILSNLPIVNSIYSSVKQINDILFLQKETQAFRRVCAVEYPRKGVYSIGFVTGEGVHAIKRKSGKEHLNVFIPTTPSPATGFMVVVPKKEVMMLDISLEDALKLIVSGGVLNPPRAK